jgi:hypothetical protein
LERRPRCSVVAMKAQNWTRRRIALHGPRHARPNSRRCCQKTKAAAMTNVHHARFHDHRCLDEGTTSGYLFAYFHANPWEK